MTRDAVDVCGPAKELLEFMEGHSDDLQEATLREWITELGKKTHSFLAALVCSEYSFLGQNQSPIDVALFLHALKADGLFKPASTIDTNIIQHFLRILKELRGCMGGNAL